MIKVTVYDWVNNPDEVQVFEGTREEVEIHMRSRFMLDAKTIPAGHLTEILLKVSQKFGIHLEAWDRVI